MTLKEQIVDDMSAARKSGNSVQRIVLSVLITELEKIEKTEVKLRPKGEVTDDEVKVTVKKLVNANIECKNETENVYLDCYLPKKLTEGELLTIIVSEINAHGYSSMKDMGKIMTHLSANYASRYDGKKASELIKTAFNV